MEVLLVLLGILLRMLLVGLIVLMGVIVNIFGFSILQRFLLTFKILEIIIIILLVHGLRLLTVQGVVVMGGV